ncbi:MAG: methyltransferase domain-containing protein [Planctomycetales bacterium]|nr:methyltransferase domain-containing protein [Planctomycetales bacterium]
MPQLATRCRLPEKMDDPQLEATQHVRALRGLQRVHAVSGTLGRLWQPLERLFAEQSGRELRVMDVGCGDGVLLRQLWHRADRHGCRLQLVGCDFSSRALGLFRAAAEQEEIPVELHCLDVLQSPLPEGADVILNSLFLHHFADQEVTEILTKFSRSARHMVVVEDLLRSRWGYYLCWCGVHLLTRSAVVHYDGLRSVEAAFSLPEIRHMVDACGIRQPRLQRHWPERFTLQWRTGQAGGR